MPKGVPFTPQTRTVGTWRRSLHRKYGSKRLKGFRLFRKRVQFEATNLKARLGYALNDDSIGQLRPTLRHFVQRDLARQRGLKHGQKYKWYDTADDDNLFSSSTRRIAHRRRRNREKAEERAVREEVLGSHRGREGPFKSKKLDGRVPDTLLPLLSLYIPPGDEPPRARPSPRVQVCQNGQQNIRHRQQQQQTRVLSPLPPTPDVRSPPPQAALVRSPEQPPSRVCHPSHPSPQSCVSPQQARSPIPVRSPDQARSPPPRQIQQQQQQRQVRSSVQVRSPPQQQGQQQQQQYKSAAAAPSSSRLEQRTTTPPPTASMHARARARQAELAAAERAALKRAAGVAVGQRTGGREGEDREAFYRMERTSRSPSDATMPSLTPTSRASSSSGASSQRTRVGVTEEKEKEAGYALRRTTRLVLP